MEACGTERRGIDRMNEADEHNGSKIWLRSGALGSIRRTSVGECDERANNRNVWRKPRGTEGRRNRSEESTLIDAIIRGSD